MRDRGRWDAERRWRDRDGVRRDGGHQPRACPATPTCALVCSPREGAGMRRPERPGPNAGAGGSGEWA
eukprot:scaffold1954_cov364-Prasinococcus_capsulatus_cf.AAC.10